MVLLGRWGWFSATEVIRISTSAEEWGHLTWHSGGHCGELINGVWGGGTRGQEKTHLRLAVKHRSSFLCPMCVPKIAPWRQIFYSLPRWLDTRSSSGYSQGISCHDWGDSLTEKTCLDWPGQDSGGKHRFFLKKAILLLILWEFQTIFSDRISHITPDLSQIYLCLPTPANFWSSFYLGIT